MKDLKTIEKWNCFFEQSGTFKNQFRKLGLSAYDYDILNDFGETDFEIDLFSEIEKCFRGGESIFSRIGEREAIFAFFPCIRFSKLAIFHMQQTGKQYNKCSPIEKCGNFIKYQEELSRFAVLITELVYICIERNIPLVIENPYGPEHYLTRYWPFLPAIIDTDRRANGDYYNKPTQYFFFNCSPLDNLIMDEPIALYPKKRHMEEDRVTRSLISPDYARRFIRKYLKIFDEKDAEI